MKRSILTCSSDFIMGSSKLIIAAIFFFMIGISSGVFTELMMSPSEKESAISYFNQYFLIENTNSVPYIDVFVNSAMSNLGLLLIIVLSGLIAFGFPVALGTLVYKGAALGFSAALLIESLPEKGILFIFTSMIPQNLILIPALMLATVASLNLSFFIFSNRKFSIKKSLTESFGPYIFIHIMLALIVLVGCFVESFICPILTGLIGSL